VQQLLPLRLICWSGRYQTSEVGLNTGCIQRCSASSGLGQSFRRSGGFWPILVEINGAQPVSFSRHPEPRDSVRRRLAGRRRSQPSSPRPRQQLLLAVRGHGALPVAIAIAAWELHMGETEVRREQRNHLLLLLLFPPSPLQVVPATKAPRDHLTCLNLPAASGSLHSAASF
jgi:hypothetical protein